MQNKRILLFFTLFFITFGTYAQVKYPVPVRPVDTLVLITPRGNYQLDAFNDTLWVFKNTQFQNALIKAKQLELCEEETNEYKNIVNLYKNQSVEKDSLIQVYVRDRDHYKENWEVCEDDFNKLILINKKNSLIKKLTIVAIPVAFVIGYLIAK